MHIAADRASAETQASAGRAPQLDASAPQAEPLGARDAATPLVRPPAELLALQRLIPRQALTQAEREPATGRAPQPESSTPQAEPLGARDAAMPQVRPPAELLALQRLVSHQASTQAEREPAAMDSAQVHQVAKRGTSGASEPLPFLNTIQRSFGRHDVSGVTAHTDRAAASAARAIAATAFTAGDHVAFAETPTLRTAAHEAAHVVQQRAGVQLRGGVGEAGDLYERHADAVADKVIAGESAEALLGQRAAVAGSASVAVQRETKDEDEKLARMAGVRLVPRNMDIVIDGGKLTLVPKGSHEEFGSVKRHSRQGRRRFIEGERKQESEHGMARIHVNQLGGDYDGQYPRATTLMIPREMALFKTMLDRHQWEEVATYIRDGRPIPDEVRRGSGPEAAITRLLMAREATQSYHITVKQIETAVRAQFAEMTPAQQALFVTQPPPPLVSAVKGETEQVGPWARVKVPTFTDEPGAAKPPTSAAAEPPGAAKPPTSIAAEPPGAAKPPTSVTDEPTPVASIKPEDWFRGEVEGAKAAADASTAKRGWVHDLGAGQYYTDRQNVAEMYADLPTDNPEGVRRVIGGKIELHKLGRVLDLTQHAEFMKVYKIIVGDPPTRPLSGEPYRNFVNHYLQRKGIKLDDFDIIVAPEGVRGGRQMVVRNPKVLEQVRKDMAVLSAKPAASVAGESAAAAKPPASVANEGAAAAKPPASIANEPATAAKPLTSGATKPAGAAKPAATVTHERAGAQPSPEGTPGKGAQLVEEIMAEESRYHEESERLGKPEADRRRAERQRAEADAAKGAQLLEETLAEDTRYREEIERLGKPEADRRLAERQRAESESGTKPKPPPRGPARETPLPGSPEPEVVVIGKPASGRPSTITNPPGGPKAFFSRRIDRVPTGTSAQPSSLPKPAVAVSKPAAPAAPGPTGGSAVAPEGPSPAPPPAGAEPAPAVKAKAPSSDEPLPHPRAPASVGRQPGSEAAAIPPVIDHDPTKPSRPPAAEPSLPAAKPSPPSAGSSPAESPDQPERPQAKPHKSFRAGFIPTVTPNGAGGTFTFTGSTPNYSAGDVSIAGHAAVSGTLLIEGGNIADAMSAYPEVSRDAIQRHGDPNALVEKVEFEEPKFVGGFDLLQRDMHADLSFGVLVKWRGNAGESRGTIHVAQAALTSKGVTGSAMSLELRHSIPVMKLQSQWHGLKVSGEVQLDLSLTLTPNWLAIGRKVLPRLVQSAAAGASEGTASGAFGGMAAAEAAVIGGAALGAYITVKSLQASLEDWDDMRKVASAAERAVQGYAGGFSAALGGKDVAGNASYHAQGAADGARMFKSSVAALLEASGNTLTEEEAGARIRRFGAANPDKFYDLVYAKVNVYIKETFVAGWKSKLSLAQRAFTNIETNELMLRTLMGLKPKQGDDGPAPPSPSQDYTGPRAPLDPIGDSWRDNEKNRTEQAGRIQGQLPQAQGRANFTGSRLAAWIKTDPKKQAIDAHSRGMELWRTANADAAKVPKNASTAELESWGHVAVAGYDAATAAFKEGLALYPSGNPP